MTTHSQTTGTDISTPIHYLLDDNDPTRTVLAYPVGRQIGLRDLKTGSIKFVKTPTDDSPKEITCLTVSSWSKYMAIGVVRQGDKRAFVQVYNINKCGMKNKLSMEIDVSDSLPEISDNNIQRYVVSLAFSPDERSIAVVLNSNPESAVLVYKWSVATSTGKTSKLLCMNELPKPIEVRKVTFHPADRTILILSGSNILK